jgi:hypothetical protein
MSSRWRQQSASARHCITHVHIFMCSTTINASNLHLDLVTQWIRRLARGSTDDRSGDPRRDEMLPFSLSSCTETLPPSYPMVTGTEAAECGADNSLTPYVESNTIRIHITAPHTLSWYTA